MTPRFPARKLPLPTSRIRATLLVMLHRLVFLLLFLTPLAHAQTPRAPDQAPYVRYVTQPRGQEHLDTAIAHFQRGPLQVDLVAAVHVADPQYYRQLQKRLDRYPRMLFELVAADGQQAVRTGVRTDSALSGVQLWIRDKLQLEFQLNGIEYRRANFVHADLSPDELLTHLRAHWTDTLGMLLRWALKDASRTTNADGSIRLGGLEILGAMAPGNHALELKRMLAQELAELGDLTAAGSDALIGRRNEAAMAVLDRELAQGAKKLAIFYGGAHMPDMERRLQQRGFVRTSTEWLVAWDLKAKPAH